MSQRYIRELAEQFLLDFQSDLESRLYCACPEEDVVKLREMVAHTIADRQNLSLERRLVAVGTLLSASEAMSANCLMDCNEEKDNYPQVRLRLVEIFRKRETDTANSFAKALSDIAHELYKYIWSVKKEKERRDQIQKGTTQDLQTRIGHLLQPSLAPPMPYVQQMTAEQRQGATNALMVSFARIAKANNQPARDRAALAVAKLVYYRRPWYAVNCRSLAPEVISCLENRQVDPDQPEVVVFTEAGRDSKEDTRIVGDKVYGGHRASIVRVHETGEVPGKSTGRLPSADTDRLGKAISQMPSPPPGTTEQVDVWVNMVYPMSVAGGESGGLAYITFPLCSYGIPWVYVTDGTWMLLRAYFGDCPNPPLP